jgi:hypothetical protein
MLVVLIRKPASAGLRDLFSHDPTYDIEPEDVRSKPASIQFPVSETTSKPESISATIAITSPDFDPPTQKRTITLQPDEDSQPVIFMLAAKQTGSLKALVEIYKAEDLIASCPLSTTATNTQSTGRPEPNIASSFFDVGGRNSQAFFQTLQVQTISHRFEIEQHKAELELREMEEERRGMELELREEAKSEKQRTESEEANQRSMELRREEEARHQISEESERKASRRSQLFETLRHLIDRGNFQAALDLLNKELSEYPNDPELLSLHRHVTDFYRMPRIMSAPAAESAPERTQTYSPPATQSAPPPPPYVSPTTASSAPAPKARKGRSLLIILGLLFALVLAFIFLSSNR